MQRLISIILVVMAICGIGNASTLKYKSSIPDNGTGIQSIQEVVIKFDFDDIKEANPTVSNWHIGCNVWNNKPIVALMKGNEILAQVYRNDALEAGDSFTVKFDNPVVLSDGEEYKLSVGDGAFSLYKDGDYEGYVMDSEAFEIIFFGIESDTKLLSFEYAIPSSNSTLSSITELELCFNEEISITPQAQALLYEINVDSPISSASLSLGPDGKSAKALFDNVILYNTHNYYIEIPENLIYLKDETENGYQTITINYSGSSYKTFGYSLVSPSYNKRVDNLGRVAVTLDCTEQEYLGRDFSAKAQLYKVEDDESLTPVGDPIACATSESTRGFYVDVYNFNLEPSSVYKIVVEEGQFHLWNTETQKPLHDTANERMEFQYRTPDEIEPMPTQAFGAATPGEAESLERLTSFRLDFEQYVYDSEFYYPVFVSYDANTLSVVDKTTGENVADFTVDIKWDNMNNYWLENVDPLDVTMLEGHEYEVTVPAGMFCCRFDPLKEVSMNEAYTVAYKGGYATSFTLTYAVEGQATLVTEVARDSEVTVSFPENDGFKVVAIAFNGEEQEVDGSFTTPAISEDSVLDIAYEYASEIDYNFTTGISLPEDCPFSVRSEGSILIISGVQPGDTVSIYSIGGLLMANLGEVPDKTKEVCFTLDNDKVYIVRINNKTLKIQH